MQPPDGEPGSDPVDPQATPPSPGPDADRLGIDLETIVDRHEFGLDWQMDLPGGGKTLGDDVTLTVHVELVKQEA